MIFLKFVLIILFLVVFFQDYSTRTVSWIVFPLIAVSCGVLHYMNSPTALISILGNISIVLIMLIMIAGYAYLKMNKSFGEVIGIGDIFLLVALTFSFGTISFIFTLIFSLIFSLTLHQLIKYKQHQNLVPLAGYVSLFFAFTYVGYWSKIIDFIYAF